MFAGFTLLLLANVYNVHSAPPRDFPADLYNPMAGNIQEMESPCPNYSRCGRDGRKYWDRLMATLASPNPVDRADGFEIYKLYYGHSRVSRSGAGQEVEQDLLKYNLGPLDDHYQRWHVFSLPSEDLDVDQDAPYQNLFNTNTGVIIGVYNWRAEDHSPKQLQWSEIAYQTYLLALKPGQSISALQVVIKTDIVNAGTYNVAKSAYKSIGLDADEDEVWRKWTLAEHEVANNLNPQLQESKADPIKFFFYAFLGTDNVKGTVYLLNDHPVALGKKIITEIWTRATPHFDMWINLGPYHTS